jgi:hypothetical protein
LIKERRLSKKAESSLIQTVDRDDHNSIALYPFATLARKLDRAWSGKSLGTMEASCSLLTARSKLFSALTSPSTSPTSTRQYLSDGSARLAKRWMSESSLPTNRTLFPDSMQA